MVNSFLLDLLFPKRCVSCGKFGSYICKKCFSEIEFIERPLCAVCGRQAIGGKTHPGCRSRFTLDGLVVGARYIGAVKQAIIKVKYKWIYDIEKVFVDLISERLWKFDLPQDLILVPVPLHAKRKRWRGFNQSEILAKALAISFSVPFSDSMIRIIETKTQVGLKREDRVKNVKGAFSLRQAQGKPLSFAVRGENILLVDDVYTSGATMSECCRVLKRAGAGEVWGLAAALG